jgi:hypothetical protein
VLGSLLVFVLASASQQPAPDPCASRQPGSAASAVVVVGPRQPGDSLVTATVCVVTARSSTAKIGSYHGELHFDSTAVRVVRVEKPAGGVRVENSTLRGQVNFAGAAPAGFPGRALVTVVLQVRPRGAQPALRLAMKELNTTDGASLMQHLVVAGAPK